MKKILVVEDNEMLGNILNILFEREGFAIDVTTNYDDAIEYLQKQTPDVVITDMILPFKSGLEVIRYVKENLKSTRIIAVSNLGFENELIIEAFKLGADDFVTKPFNPKELLIRVTRFFDTCFQLQFCS